MLSCCAVYCKVSPLILCPCRRQNELMTPLLFEVAHSGNKDLLFAVLENGDDVNPIVSIYRTIRSESLRRFMLLYIAQPLWVVTSYHIIVIVVYILYLERSS